MNKFEKRIFAQKLRSEGVSIKDIAKKLDVAKSSVSLWCKDIFLSPEVIRKITLDGYKKNLKGRLMGSLINKNKKINKVNLLQKEAEKEIVKISKRDMQMLSVGLFWSEGSKTGSRFIFSNSDPAMIVFMYKFLHEVMLVKKSDIYFTLQINQIHKSRIDDVLQFWSKLLHLSPGQINKPYFVKVKPKKIYQNFNEYFGLMRLQVRKSSGLQYKMLAFVKRIKQLSG